MRTARLDHDPNSGIVFRTLCSNVPQPIHTRTGEVANPLQGAPKIDAPWLFLLGKLVIRLHSVANVAREIGCSDKSSVGKWARGKRQPSPAYHSAIIAAYRKWVSQDVPGVVR